MHAIKIKGRLLCLGACFTLSACNASNEDQQTAAIREDTGSEQVIEKISEPGINTESARPPLCLTHPNGIVYCVDHNNRRFSATHIDNTEWWAFVLPGNNSSNAVIAILAVQDKIAIIADKTPGAVKAENEFENERYEVSLFESHGAFIDTRHLLKIPSENAFVAICSDESTDTCVTSLATHQFSQYDSWQYEHPLPLVDEYSTQAINANNFELLIDNLHDFWGTEHFHYIGAELGEFYKAVEGQMVVSLEARQEDIPTHWLEKYSDSVDLYKIELCPDGGSVITFDFNPWARLFKDCQYLDWTVNGEISTKAAHRTSDFHYKTIAVTRTNAEHAMDGGYTFIGGGLYGSNSFSTRYFLSTTAERRTEVTGLSYSSRYGSDSRGSIDGWRVVLADGRTGNFVDKGSYFSQSEVSYWMKDSFFSNISMKVSAKRKTSLNRRSIKLSDGSYVPANRVITYTLIDPGDGRSGLTTSFDNILAPPYFTDGTTTFAAEDGSTLVITPYFQHHTPLAKVNLRGGEKELPQVTTYMDYRTPNDG